MSAPDPETLVLMLGREGGDRNISSKVRNLQLTWVAPGGHGECRFTVVTTLPAGSDDVRVSGMEHLFVSDSLGTFAHFRVEVFSREHWTGGTAHRLIARGMKSSADDNVWPNSMKFLIHTPLADIYTATKALIPDVQIGTLDTGGRIIPAESPSFQGQSGAQIWEWAATQGTAGAEALHHEVVYDVGGGFSVLNVRPRHSGWDYKTRMDVGTKPRVDQDTQQVFNRYYVKYEKGELGRYVTVDDAVSQGVQPGGIAAIRSRFIDASELDGDAAAAAALGQAHLNQTAVVRSIGGDIEVPYPRMVFDTGGNPVRPWRVQAGKNLLIEDLGITVWIIESIWDEERRTLTLRTNQRNQLVESMARALAKKEPQNDPTKSAVIPHPATILREQPDYDLKKDLGSRNAGVRYAPQDHAHGTPNGDISATVYWETGDPTVPVPTSTTPTYVGLIHGTWLRWRINLSQGDAVIRFTFPDGHQFFASGSAPGAEGDIGPVEVQTETEVEVLRQVVNLADTISVNLYGTRNWLLSGNDADPPHWGFFDPPDH